MLSKKLSNSSAELTTVNPQATHLLIRHNDLALKGRNRPEFEKLLQRSLTRTVPEGDTVISASGRMLVRMDTANRQAESVISRIRKISKVPGVAAVTPCLLLSRTKNLEGDLYPPLLSWVESDLRAHPEVKTFAVRARRIDPQTAGTSMDLERTLGSAVQQKFTDLKVSLKRPDYTIRIEVRPKHLLVHSYEEDGVRGLPMNPEQRVVCLLSGGIDSPVAVYEVLRRGCSPILVHFHSVPFTSQAGVYKVKKLAARIREFSPAPLELWLVPFVDIQKAVRDSCTDRFRTVHYRRMMMILAQELAYKRNALALVTGEALGQVASQTLRNIGSIEDSVTMPVLRPLITSDKDQIVKKAKTLGTYEISIEPHEDTCVLFAPAKPSTRANLNALREEQARLPVYQLVFDALDRAEKVLI